MVDKQPTHDCQGEAYRDYLRLLARLWMPRRLHRKMDASDLVQDTLMKAYAKGDQFQGNCSRQYKAWLRVILKRTLLDRIEKYERTPEQSARGVERSSSRLESWIEADQSSPSERAIRHEQLEHLAQLLAQLPEDQQEVLVRKHCLGLKVADIAEDLGRTTASVAGLLRRGLERLRDHLDEE
jgi:RNA polymerase sigma-70 factor (ECF subfamily)